MSCQSEETSRTVPLGTVFAGWYGHDPMTGECKGELGSTHWNDSPDTGGVVHTPMQGYYCSSDPEIVDWQLKMMQRGTLKKSVNRKGGVTYL